MNERERLIELQKSCCADEKVCQDNCLDCMTDHLLANGVTVQRWIPVTERLPTREDANPNESVLAIAKKDGFGRTWIWEIVAEYPQEFTHWQSFPEPPKEEE